MTIFSGRLNEFSKRRLWANAGEKFRRIILLNRTIDHVTYSPRSWPDQIGINWTSLSISKHMTLVYNKSKTHYNNYSLFDSASICKRNTEKIFDVFELLKKIIETSFFHHNPTSRNFSRASHFKYLKLVDSVIFICHNLIRQWSE